jgi:hypothetical protein
VAQLHRGVTCVRLKQSMGVGGSMLILLNSQEVVMILDEGRLGNESRIICSIEAGLAVATVSRAENVSGQKLLLQSLLVQSTRLYVLPVTGFPHIPGTWDMVIVVHRLGVHVSRSQPGYIRIAVVSLGEEREIYICSSRLGLNKMDHRHSVNGRNSQGRCTYRPSQAERLFSPDWRICGLAPEVCTLAYRYQPGMYLVNTPILPR